MRKAFYSIALSYFRNILPDLLGMAYVGRRNGRHDSTVTEDWVKTAILGRLRLANRKSKLIRRIPFSSTIGWSGAYQRGNKTNNTSRNRTRNFVGLPGRAVWADLKFNWSILIPQQN